MDTKPAIEQRVLILRTQQKGRIKAQWPRVKKGGRTGWVYDVMVDGKHRTEKFFEDEIIPYP